MKKEDTRVLRRISTVLLILLTFLIFASGCDLNRYGATLYSHAHNWVDDNFLYENQVKGSAYLNKDYVEGTSDYNEKYLYAESAPETRNFIITDKERFDEIFTNCPLSVDFDKEMIILHIFTNTNSRKHYLKSIDLNDGVLTVKTEESFQIGNDTTMPGAVCFVIKMKKIDITDVIFEK